MRASRSARASVSRCAGGAAGRPIAAATLAGSLLFFLLTNLAVWWWLDSYPRTPEGLLACYVAGLPQLASGLLGDGAYATLLFGGLALAEVALPRRDRARHASSS